MNEPIKEIVRWCAQHETAVLFDEAAATLRDVFSGKTLRLPRMHATEEKTARDTGETYLVVMFDDERQLALAGVGITFPPDLRNAGPLPGMPQVVCWRDFANVTGQIEHALSAHPDVDWGAGAPLPVGQSPPGPLPPLAPGREVLDMLRYCIALLDGARTAGFDVGEEERRLEGYVAIIEKRVGKS